MVFYRLGCVLLKRKKVRHYVIRFRSNVKSVCVWKILRALECSEYLKRVHSNVQIRSKLVSVVLVSSKQIELIVSIAGNFQEKISLLQ